MTEIADSSGNVLEHYRYSPFGALKIFNSSWTEVSESTVGNTYCFTGRNFDRETGLYFYRARMYSAGLGRFLQVDPANYTDDFNLYMYVNNDPIDYIDPWGLKVYICSRYVIRFGDAFAHTWTEIVDSQGKTTYSGTREGILTGVRKNDPPDYAPTCSNPETSRVEIPPPPGLTEQQWDNAVRYVAEIREMKKHKKRLFNPAGGGGSYTANCHEVTREIIEGAGGKIPPEYDPPGRNPGLH